MVEILLNQISFVTERQNEIRVPELGINFHDMPEDRLSSDRNHGFGAVFSLFAQAGSKSSAENDRLDLFYHNVCLIVYVT